MSTTSWLVRLQPYPDESASSWRQRLAWSNGYQLFPILDNRRRRRDPDLQIAEDELIWLSDLTQLPSKSILDLFVSNKQSMKPLFAHASRHFPWVVHAKPVAGFGHGSMFCPVCLKTDKVPYFRWYWRLGFMNVCKDHGMLMLDRCPNCKIPPWPCGSGVKSRIHPSFEKFLNCWNCGADLGEFEQTSTEANSYSAELYLLATGEPVALGDLSATSIEKLEALRSIGHIFLRNRLRQRIATSSSGWAEVASALPSDLSSINMIENVSAKYRAPIVNAAAELMADWPHSFLEFCVATKINRADFYDTGNLMPWWMQECIDKKLSKRNRSVGFDDVMQAIEELTIVEGASPTNSQIRRHLGWHGEKALRNVNVKRTEGAFEEWEMFCDEIRHQLVLSTIRIDCRAGLLRDLFAIALCSRDNLSTKDVSLLPRENLFAASNWYELEKAIVLHWGVTPNELNSKLYDSLFDVDLQRAIQKRVRLLMRKLPRDLMRSPSVFRRFLFQQTSDPSAGAHSSSCDTGIEHGDVECSQLALPFE